MTHMTTTDPTNPNEEHHRMSKITARLFGGKRKFAAIGLACLLLPGSAMAAWLLTSHGQGVTRVGSLQAPTVSEGNPYGIDPLVPGETGPASFTIANPSQNGRVEVYEVALGDGTGSSSQPAACPASSLLVHAHTLTNPVIVQPGESEVAIPDTYKLAPNAPETCQGVTLKQDVTLKFRTPVTTP